MDMNSYIINVMLQYVKNKTELTIKSLVQMISLGKNFISIH